MCVQFADCGLRTKLQMQTSNSDLNSKVDALSLWADSCLKEIQVSKPIPSIKKVCSWTSHAIVMPCNGSLHEEPAYTLEDGGILVANLLRKRKGRKRQESEHSLSTDSVPSMYALTYWFMTSYGPLSYARKLHCKSMLLPASWCLIGALYGALHIKVITRLTRGKIWGRTRLQFEDEKREIRSRKREEDKLSFSWDLNVRYKLLGQFRVCPWGLGSPSSQSHFHINNLWQRIPIDWKSISSFPHIALHIR